MFFETDLANAIFWFFSGVILYDFVSKMIGYSRTIYLISLGNLIVLKTLGGLEEDMAFLKQLKYLSFKESGMTDKKLESVQKEDEETLQIWRQTVIDNIRAAHPRKFKVLLEYKNWDEAMTLLTKITKKTKKDS